MRPHRASIFWGPKFIRNPSHFILLTQQLLVRFCLVFKSNFSRSFKQTPISSLEYEIKKIYSSTFYYTLYFREASKFPFSSFIPSGLYGALYPKLKLRAIDGVGVNLEASKK